MISMKQRHRFFILAAFLAVSVNVAFSDVFSQINIIIVYVAEIIILWAALLGYMVYSNTKYLDMINRDCDPYKFYDRTKEIRTSYKANIKFQAMCLLNESTAFLAMGKYEDTLAMLDSKENENFGINSNISYYINKATCYYNLEKTEEFKENMEIINSVENKFNQPIQFSIELLNKALEYTQKDPQAQENIINYRSGVIDMLNNSNAQLNKYQRLTLMYTIGQLELKLGNDSEAENYFKTVAEEGNRLFIAEKSREMLKESESNNKN